ncbi:MAG: hypothetical protein ACO3EZ_03185 [Prochlorotrichaceae cyanobacterium]
MPYIEKNPYHTGATVIFMDFDYREFHYAKVVYTNGYSYHLKSEEFGIICRTRPEMDFAQQAYEKACEEHREMVRWQRDSSAVD